MADDLASSNVNRSYSLAATSIAIFTFMLVFLKPTFAYKHSSCRREVGRLLGCQPIGRPGLLNPRFRVRLPAPAPFVRRSSAVWSQRAFGLRVTATSVDLSPSAHEGDELTIRAKLF